MNNTLDRTRQGDEMSAQERYDELKAGEDAMDAVERLRFFCSLAMNGQDWIDVEPYFDGVLAELEALRADAERYWWLRAGDMWHNFLAVAKYDEIPAGTLRYFSVLLDRTIDEALAARKEAPCT